MTQIFVNPGSGSVEGGTYENAHINMQQWIVDYAKLHGVNLVWTRTESLDREGRFGFTVYRGDDEYSEIEMPGLPIERVRFLGLEGQNIWDYPRLYVDGDSWVWKYALDVAFTAHGEDDD